jgi:hypothetical protein
MIHALLEEDVTEARQIIREHRVRTGEKPLFLEALSKSQPGFPGKSSHVNSSVSPSASIMTLSMVVQLRGSLLDSGN